MHGQWIGHFSGTNSGEAIIELDQIGDHYEGRAYVFDDQPGVPSTAAFVTLPRESKRTPSILSRYFRSIRSP